MLQGRHLSPVQQAALELSLVLDEQQRARDFTDRYRLAVVGADPTKWTPLMFPDWGSSEDDSEEGPTEWVFTEEMTQERAEQVLAELAGEDMVMSGADLERWR